MKTKKEFLNFLDKRLSILKEEEKNEVLNEYSQHIDMKVQEGQSEEDAIKNFGNLDDFVDEILDAYNINSAYNKKNIETEKITEAIDTGVDVAKTFFQRVREYIKGISNYILNEKPSKILIFLMKIGICFVYSLYVWKFCVEHNKRYFQYWHSKYTFKNCIFLLLC